MADWGYENLVFKRDLASLTDLLLFPESIFKESEPTVCDCHAPNIQPLQQGTEEAGEQERCVQSETQEREDHL